MEIIINAAIFKSPEDITEFKVVVTNKTKDKVKQKLKYEKNKIVDYLRRLKEIGQIKTLTIPKNKHIQKQLDNLVRIKKKLNKSIVSIDTIFSNR